jgi:hypothetical protein
MIQTQPVEVLVELLQTLFARVRLLLGPDLELERIALQMLVA